ncbi:MAGE family-domain-containing protein [Scheffersomyces amazonensis]|uniref:MAGE family-domain-containing protein n=1 Tax=Scheffersomyces amazonensis TaxID=1078765 RepID=UPI00315D0624
MPKRRIEDDEEDEESEVQIGEEESDSQYDEADHEENHNRHGLNEAVGQVIRIVLGRDVRDQFIRREHFAQAVNTNTRRFHLDTVIAEADNVLQEVYGLKLVEVPVIKKDKKSSRSLSQKITKTKQPYMVVNCLSSESQQILGELWQKSSDFLVPNERDSSQHKFLIPKKEKTSTLLSNFELIRTGIMLYIVSFIILSENHLSEHDLIKLLKKRGIPESLSIKNSNINMNSVEIINDLTKREYLLKDIKKGATESENIIDYSLGRRSLIEFTPQCVFEYFKVLFGDKFDSTTAERIVVTIHRAYGVELSQDISAVGTEVNTPVNESDRPNDEEAIETTD